MGLDTDLNLIKMVSGPDFVRSPTVGPPCDPGGLDPLKFQMMYQLPFHMIQAYERGGSVLCDSPPHNSWVKKSFGFASRSMYTR